MATCPACAQILDDDTEECPFCGVLLAKWRARPAPSRTGVPLTARSSVLRASVFRASGAGGRSSDRRALLLLLGGGVAVAIVWFVFERANHAPGAAGPRAPRRLVLRDDPVSDFDRDLELPSGPSGMAWSSERQELVIANRDQPWGFQRLRRLDADRYALSLVPVREPAHGQEMSFDAVAWNGRSWVAITSGAWFEEPGKVFTEHDADTFELLRHQRAPPLLGALVWDGRGYWAATRRNTEDTDEEAFLYRLDDQLRVGDRFEPPAVGCQGLAVDGDHLWFADVFSDRLFLLDLRPRAPALVHSYPIRFDYPSGLAFDGEVLWIVDYEDDKLRRLNPRLALAWKARPAPTGDAFEETFEEVISSLETVVEPLDGADESAPSAREVATMRVKLPGSGDPAAGGATGLDGDWFGHALTRPEDEWVLLILGERYFLNGPGLWMSGRFAMDSGGHRSAGSGRGTLDFEIEKCDCGDIGKIARARYVLERGTLEIAGFAPGDPRIPASPDGRDNALAFRFERFVPPPVEPR
jgi:hypothetical protein